MPWFQCDARVRDDIKIARLAKTLDVKYVEAVGLMVCLWGWAAEHERSGNLSDMTPDEIAHAARHEDSAKIDAKRLISALKECRLLDATMRIHNWRKRGVSLLEAKRKSMQKKRAALNHCGTTTEPPCALTYLHTHLLSKERTPAKPEASGKPVENTKSNPAEALAERITDWHMRPVFGTKKPRRAVKAQIATSIHAHGLDTVRTLFERVQGMADPSPFVFWTMLGQHKRGNGR